MRNILLLILLGAIAGCAPIKTKTTVFHAPDYVSKGTLMVVADDPNINSSLEFTSYKKKFENKLSQHGYTIVNDINNAEYKAIVAYGVSNGRTAISSDPIYDDFGRKVGSETSSTTRYTRIISMEIFKINNLQGTVERFMNQKQKRRQLWHYEPSF